VTEKVKLLALCAVALSLSGVFGFQSDTSSLARTFNKTLALTNSQITVTVLFTNGGTVAARGFYYADQVPSGLAVSTSSLWLNGKAVTNFLFESGQDGDVYDGCTPYRWVFERPEAFTETNPIPAQAPAQIVYTVTSSSSNIVNFQQFSWVGFGAAQTNAVFGYSENVDQQTVRFTTTAERVSVSARSATNGVLLELSGVPDYTYVIEASTNFASWVSHTTNTSPFGYLDTNHAGFRQRFYRGRLY
jgi:uncharacterized repeat protein (TIGR01451 family)